MNDPITAPPGRETLLAKSMLALGWDEVLAALESRAESEPGKRECLAPRLCETAAAAGIALSETREMADFFDRGDPPPPLPFSDAAALVESARSRAISEPLELVRIMDLLVQAARARGFFLPHPEAERLHAWASRLEECGTLRRALERSLDRDGSVLDSASPELASLRSQHRTLRERIHRRLGEIVAGNADDVLQDNFYTQRNQRYVVPVKASAQGRFEGIVHDASASGQTVFVEPAELVSPNNRLRLIEVEIEAEIMRVLKDLSAQAGAAADALLDDQSVLSHLDGVRARARLASDLRASCPILNERGEMRIASGRHPLLLLRRQEVTPNDFELGGSARVLLVSGPNTGGKTVGLKLLGLFALMVRAGMFIPAGPDSEMAIFPEVYAVIGDDQDMARDLSSFSAHLLDLVGILAAAGEGSLVLLDELMNSTDPAEGAALGAAVLAALRDQGALVAATTHIPTLKSFAHEEPGFVNAGYSFDPDTFEPTYRLITGVPGRSLGIDMAARLGLPARHIERARSMMDESSQRLESLIAELTARFAEVETEKDALARERVGLATQAEEYRRLRERLSDREREFKRQVKDRVREAARKVEEELESIMAPLRARRGAAREDLLKTREDIRALRERVEDEYRETGSPGGRMDWSAARKNDRIVILPLGIEARLLEWPPGEVRDDAKVKAQVGRLQVMVDAGKVRSRPEAEDPDGRDALAVAPKKDKRPQGKPPRRPEAREPAAPTLPPAAGNSLDLRGLRAYEAEARIDEFLDSACRRRLANVFIIHGHGTGTLKLMVRELLPFSPYVESFRPGEKGEGGDGVTMVKLLDLGSGDLAGG